jgi:hypothetical protein
MTATKTLELEAKTNGRAAADSPELTGKAVKDRAERAAQATADHAERTTRTDSDAAERMSKAAVGSAAEMADTVAESFDFEALASTAREGLDAATKTQQRALQSIERVGASFLTGIAEMQKEVAGFVAERIRQDLEAQQELLGCRTFDEVREVQSRFFRTTLDQYSTEATKLTQLSTEVLMRTIDTRAS